MCRPLAVSAIEPVVAPPTTSATSVAEQIAVTIQVLRSLRR